MANVGLNVISVVSADEWVHTVQFNPHPFKCAPLPVPIPILKLSNSVSALYIDRFGRRPLLLTTLIVILAVNILISTLMIAFEQTQVFERKENNEMGALTFLTLLNATKKK